ncbi:hypothetical protein MMC26_004625 [Xylographa opegraphella]|nr:hypothetical protein [Xylographa opegraphella]
MVRSYTVPDWVFIAIALPLTPVWLPILCAHGAYRCLRPKSTNEEQMRRARNANRPPQLPYSRRFHPSTDALPRDDLPASPLLRLPYSVRRQIYSHLFADRYILHITTRPKRLAHTQSLYPSCWAPNQHTRRSAKENPPFSCCIDTDHLDLEILRTCRTVYQEAHPLVYRTNTFAMHHLDALVYFNQCVRPQHLGLIRYLFIEWDMPFVPVPAAPGFQRPYDHETWARVWNIVAVRLTGLEALDLLVRLWMPGVEYEACWLQEVGRVRGLKTFVLDVKYPSVLRLGSGVEVGEENRALRRKVERMVKWPRGQGEPAEI